MESGEPSQRTALLSRQIIQTGTATRSKERVGDARLEGLEVHQAGHVRPCRGAGVGEEEGGVRRKQGGKCLFQNAEDGDGAEGVEWTF